MSQPRENRKLQQQQHWRTSGSQNTKSTTSSGGSFSAADFYDGDFSRAPPSSGSASISGSGSSTTSGAASVTPTRRQATLQGKQKAANLNQATSATTVGPKSMSNQQPTAVRQTNQQANQKAQATEVRSTSSGSHRLGSVEILNENKQRHKQLEQQEAFKQQIEQRQRLIREQQQAGLAADENNFAYQVDTSVPEYMASAAAKSTGESAGGGPTNSHRSRAGGIAVNPFDCEDDSVGAGRIAKPKNPTKDSLGDKTVSGKSGFLAALMDDDGSFEQTDPNSKSTKADINGTELNNPQTKSTALEESRYNKLAGSTQRSYNYNDDSNKRPFYEKSWAEILQDCRSSRRLVIMIVAIALLLDNMLLTSVVPIIPAYLYKLRIERQQRELLETGQTANGSADGSLRAKLFPMGADSKQTFDAFDEDAFNEELERRINQSIAAARDRFSGSVFHPRLRAKPNSKGARDDDNSDDNDDDEDDDRRQTNDDGQDDDGQPDGKSAKMSSAKAKSSAANAESNDDDDDDYEDAQPDETPTRGSRKMQKGQNDTGSSEDSKRPSKVSAGRRQSTAQQAAPKSQMKDPNDSRGDSSKEDDDDEELDNSRRWTKLRGSLESMAQATGNDTSAMGGMCLNMVLGQAAGEDDNDEDESATKESRKSKMRSKDPQRRSKARETREARVEEQRRPKGAKSGHKDGPKGRPAMPPGEQKKEVDRRPASSKMPMDDDGHLIISHQDIVDESLEVGIMFASKPIVQAFANPFIGSLTNKVGFTIPMFTGFVIMFLSTLVFAFGSTYSTLLFARAIQGIGSACTSVAGMSMLADRFPDDAERGNAMAVALGGLALGVVIGPPFGGFMYEFVGKSSPFLVLSLLALLDGLLQLMVLQPRVTESPEEGASLMTLIKDPYILVAAGAITFANTGIAILEPSLPLWMMDTMQATNFEQGVAFLPAALSYMVGTNLFGTLGHRIGRWRSTMIGLVIIGVSLLLIPFASRVHHLIIPNGAIGFAMGMVDSTMMPMLGYLVDIRHTSVYGSVYAIGDVAFCASFAFGPALSGTLVELIGFEGLIITTAIICFGFAPLLYLLRDPPARQLNESQLREQAALRYVNYSQLDSPDEEAQLTGGGEKKYSSKTYVH